MTKPFTSFLPCILPDRLCDVCGEKLAAWTVWVPSLRFTKHVCKNGKCVHQIFQDIGLLVDHYTD